MNTETPDLCLVIHYLDPRRQPKVLSDLPRERDGKRYAEALFEELMPAARKDAERMELLEQPRPGETGGRVRLWTRGMITQPSMLDAALIDEHRQDQAPHPAA